MQEFNEHNPRLFEKELGEITAKYRSNIQYFIYKSIILRNLYGVDIMVEATEIAKLRLFLKMVAVVEVDRRAENLGLDPLPDIDFNIRCGNSLVGYANEEELNRDLEVASNFMQLLANQEFKDKIEEEMYKVSKTYELFRSTQLTQSEDMAAFKHAKRELRERLAKLNDTLNRRLFTATQSDSREPSTTKEDLFTSALYREWLKSHKPFHWLAEFYDIIRNEKDEKGNIIKNGGFAVIIGNPPYVEFPSKDVPYHFPSLQSSNCGNLYGCCIERGYQIGDIQGRFSFIIPVAITCSKRMAPVINIMKRNSAFLQFANFDDRPGKLFEMIEHLRASIFISSRSSSRSQPKVFSSKYNRWYTQQRCNLFSSLEFVDVTKFVDSYTIPKFSYLVECSINSKLQNVHSIIGLLYGTDPKNSLYYRAAGGGYFLLVKTKKSITYINGVLEEVKAEKSISFKDTIKNTNIAALVSSSLFYWNYIGYTDCRNLTKSFIDNFPCPTTLPNDAKLTEIGVSLFRNYEENRYRKDTFYKSTNRNVIYYEYYPKLSKSIIDQIDTSVSKHFGLTAEELDFIINYDIKFRMGDELNSDE